MRAPLVAIAILYLAAAPLGAAALDTPALSTPFDTAGLSEPFATSHFFSTDSFLTNVGMSYCATSELTLEPELGLGYHGRDLELHGGMEQSIHRVHAQAGWRLSLADTLYLSAAAKLPMVTVEGVGLCAGEDLGIRPEPQARQGYDFTNPARERLSFRGEFGIHLSPSSDLMLYYDQSPVYQWYTGGAHQEDRVGTRFILRFK